MASTISKKKFLKKSRLYVILDKDTLKSRLEKVAGIAAKNKNIDIIQLRDKISPKIEILKTVLKLRQLFSKKKIIFIVNDFPDIAKISAIDGVHLGQKDLGISQARRMLGKRKIIGGSCHNLKQLKAGIGRGADYLALGPVFATPTKPGLAPLGLELLKQAKLNKIKSPVFSIGGITSSNIEKVLAAGANRVAVCSVVIKAKRPNIMINNLRKKINKSLTRD